MLEYMKFKILDHFSHLKPINLLIETILSDYYDLELLISNIFLDIVRRYNFFD
jgi:hypothetical protein